MLTPVVFTGLRFSLVLARNISSFAMGHCSIRLLMSLMAAQSKGFKKEREDKSPKEGSYSLFIT